MKLKLTVKNEYKPFFKTKKRQAELNYWKSLMDDLTKGCDIPQQKKEKLLKTCRDVTFPRYKKDLFLNDDSFIGKRILDVGCGPNAGIIGFNRCEKYGADHLIDEYTKLGYPLDSHGINYYNAKSEKLPFANAYFDVAICVNALDHVDSLDKTIKEISRVLKVGGKFIGQINFREKATITEPKVISHEQLIKLLLKNDLLIIKRLYQYHIYDEDRYYYECEKSKRN